MLKPVNFNYKVIKNMSSNHKNHGFTLIELLVVMVIIGLLVSYVGPRYFNQLSQSEVKAAKAQIDSIKKALDVYRLDNGAYPDQATGLMALMVEPPAAKKWRGPYLQKDIPSDPWNQPYIYRIPGEKAEFDLLSLGADARPGGENENADIVN